MRTTVYLNPSVLQSAKKIAAKRHTTLTALIDEGLRYILSLSSVKLTARSRIKVKTVKGLGLKNGVNIDDNASLLTKMEE